MFSMDACASSFSVIVFSDNGKKANKSSQVSLAVLDKQKLENFRMPLPSSRI